MSENKKAKERFNEIQSEILEMMKELPVEDLRNLKELADELFKGQGTGEDSMEIARAWMEKYYPNQEINQEKVDLLFSTEVVTGKQ